MRRHDAFVLANLNFCIRAYFSLFFFIIGQARQESKSSRGFSPPGMVEKRDRGNQIDLRGISLLCLGKVVLEFWEGLEDRYGKTV